MHWQPFLAVPAALASSVASASVYLSVAQAQQAIFPGARLAPVNFLLSAQQRDEVFVRAGVHEPFRENRVWSVEGGGFFIVDEVVGKHEMITYAVGIGADGTVRQIEILEYRESYGSEIRDAAWRQQFVGKGAASPLKLNRDIVNITGATLSSKHVTDGVRRVLAVYDLALKGLPRAGA